MRAVASILAIALFAGCQTPKAVKTGERAVYAYHNGNYRGAIARLEPLSLKTDENYVLNNLRLGSAALAAYDLDEAESSFLRAWEVINAGGVNSGGRAVAATWIDEKLKIWKGEPYERAMASFYLGLVYYMRQDYNNARAAFENSLFKLRDYAGKNDKDFSEQESTFTVALIMLGRTYQRLGREDLSRANFDEALKLQPALQPLADYEINLQSNVLLAVDFGYGPRKRTDFDGSIVGFVPEPGRAGRLPRPVVVVDGREISEDELRPVVTFDTIQMAADRRWQSIDTIRTVKSGLGTALIAGGAGYGIYRAGSGEMRGEDLAIAGGLIAAGALLKATSQADVRQWEMMPRTTFLLPLRLSPGTHDITVVFPQADGLRQSWQNVYAPPTGDATYYLRMNRWLPGPFVFHDPHDAPQAARTATTDEPPRN